jgi:YggT family protein
VTDPPLKALRRVLPPLRIGQISLDLGFIVLFIVVRILMSVAVVPRTADRAAGRTAIS